MMARADTKEAPMPDIDVSQLKNELPDITTKHIEELNLLRANLSTPETVRNRRAVGKLRERELRALFEKRKAYLAKYGSTIEGAIRQSIEAENKAIERLPWPLKYHLQVLDRPFLIMQTSPPHDIDTPLVDTHAESNNSRIRIRIDHNTPPQGRIFSFYFVWSNDSNDPALISAYTPIEVNGTCYLTVAPGFFVGDEGYLWIQAGLGVLRWRGWGTDPTTGQSLDGTYYPVTEGVTYQSLAYLHATGGRGILLEGAGHDGPLAFDPTYPYNFSARVITVPARAVVIFDVFFETTHTFDGDWNNIENAADVDFANSDLGYCVKCRRVLLEVLSEHLVVGPGIG
jgi:hypothetical protein